MIDAVALRKRLLAADYTFEAVAAALGEHGQLGLARNQTMPAQIALAGRDDAVAILIRLFILQLGQPANSVTEILGEQPEIIEIRGQQAYALIDIRPYGSPDDDATGWVVSDLMPGLNGVTTPTRPDYVLGVSPASQTLTEMTIRRPVTAALDLGTGCGVQSLHLAHHAQRIVATDLNPRAVELARLTFALNQQDIEIVEGSLFEPVADQKFDLIVSNPPYVMSPPRIVGEKLTYREGGLVADELVRRVVVEGVDHLAPGGVVQVLANWVAAAEGAAAGERIVGWLGDRDDIDIVVMERERLDKFAYVEMWLTDAGLAGDSAWESRYQEWLSYFDDLDIAEVSMGWIVVRRRREQDLGERYVRVEQWSHAVSQPVGDAFMRDLDGIERSRALSDTELLAANLALREHIQEERYGVPGAADPASIVLRQQSGFCRGYLCTTQLAAVLGACDGELSLGTIVDVVAQITEVDVDELRREVLCEVRELMQQGWFC
ncbi:MAG: methyltransferase [Propionibacteriaceae bacterium]